MKKILIASITRDSNFSVYYLDSFYRTMVLSSQLGVVVLPLWLKADENNYLNVKNFIVQKACEFDVDALYFINSNVFWNENDIFKLLNRDENVLGVPVRSFYSEEEVYNFSTSKKFEDGQSLVEVDFMNLDFIRLNKKVLDKIKEKVETIKIGNSKMFVCFNSFYVEDGFVNSDTFFINFLKSLDEKLYIDLTCSCSIVQDTLYNNLNCCAWLKNKTEIQNDSGETENEKVN